MCTDDDELVGGDGRPRSSRVDFRVGSTDGAGRPYSHGGSHHRAVIIQRDTEDSDKFICVLSSFTLHTTPRRI